MAGGRRRPRRAGVARRCGIVPRPGSGPRTRSTPRPWRRCRDAPRGDPPGRRPGGGPRGLRRRPPALPYPRAPVARRALVLVLVAGLALATSLIGFLLVSRLPGHASRPGRPAGLDAFRGRPAPISRRHLRDSARRPGRSTWRPGVPALAALLTALLVLTRSQRAASVPGARWRAAGSASCSRATATRDSLGYFATRRDKAVDLRRRPAGPAVTYRVVGRREPGQRRPGRRPRRTGPPRSTPGCAEARDLRLVARP